MWLAHRAIEKSSRNLGRVIGLRATGGLYFCHNDRAMTSTQHHPQGKEPMQQTADTPADTPETGHTAAGGAQRLRDTLRGDGQPHGNFASFVTTWMDDEAERRGRTHGMFAPPSPPSTAAGPVEPLGSKPQGRLGGHLSSLPCRDDGFRNTSETLQKFFRAFVRGQRMVLGCL
jgi:hypothetical protein